MMNFLDILKETGLEERTKKIAGKDIEMIIDILTKWKIFQVKELKERDVFYRDVVYFHELRVLWYIASAKSYLATVNIAEEGIIPEESIILTIIAAYMHGIIKYKWPKEMFTKQKENFDDKEKNKITIHPQETVDLLKNILSKDLYNKVKNIIFYHHEFYSGKGYPEGLAGKGIPVGSRILKPFDSLDAATTERLYLMASNGNKKIKTIGDMLKEFKEDLSKDEDKQFDPYILKGIINFFEEKRGIAEKIHNYKWVI